jgi:hypothetical protein
VPDLISHHQSDFDFDGFTPDWTVDLSQKFFADLRMRWADPWFRAFGVPNQIKRTLNEVLTLEVNSTRITVIFNGPPKTFAFPQPIEMMTKSSPSTPGGVDIGEYQSSFFSKDLAPLFRTLMTKKARAWTGYYLDNAKLRLTAAMKLSSSYSSDKPFSDAATTTVVTRVEWDAAHLALRLLFNTLDTTKKLAIGPETPTVPRAPPASNKTHGYS